MPTTRFKGETAGERLDKSSISDSDMLQLRHKPGTIEDADKGISKAQLLSCPFGVSDTAAATAAKAADLTDSNPDFTLVSGREVVVCFTTANTASNPTLNFAGSGAIPLYRTNGEAVSNWPADTWMHLKYFFATVGNTTIQRWILLSPLPVDEVTANNMNSVTSNAVNPIKQKADVLYDNNILLNVRNLPIINYGDLPSRSDQDETYFKEWIDYLVANNYFDNPNDVFIAQASPNFRVFVIGYTYGYGETSVKTWSAFRYFNPNGGIGRFGYNNGIWYFSQPQ